MSTLAAKAATTCYSSAEPEKMPNQNPCEGKKAQYLTLDAFIASMIVAVAIVIILAARTTLPYTSQSEAESRNLAESLSQIKLRELNNPMIINMSKNGTITNTDNTVLQQATEFYFLGNEHYAFELLRSVSQELIPRQYSFNIIVNNNLLYNRTIRTENSSSVLVSSKKLIYGVVNKTAFVYGPTIAEVRLWQ